MPYQKKNALTLITLFFICVFNQSCQKELTVEPPIPPVNTPHDSITVLSQVIYIDLNVSETDTVAGNTYSYDSMQRVTTIDYGEFIDTYYYKGSDSLAYKMTEKSLDPQNPFSPYTVWYFYDNLKRLIEDSISSDITGHYTYSPTMITAFRKGIDYQNNLLIITDTGFVGSTGDIVKTNGKDDYADGIFNFHTVNYTYDNKRNPFYEMNIRSTYNPVATGDFFIDGYYLQKNNTLAATSGDPLAPNLSNSTHYNYTYNSLNLPVAVDVVYNGGSDDDSRILFVYMKI